MDITQTYREEAIELLSELENSLLELETNPNDTELIGRVFRAMHTIKGSGAMAGFENIASFTHDIETVFDLVRSDIIPVSKELIDLTLNSCDLIRKMVDNEPPDEKYTEEIIGCYKEMIPLDEKVPEKNDNDNSENIIGDEIEEITYRIRFHPADNILANGTNPILLFNEIRELGECSLVAQTDEIPLLKDTDPEKCYLYWDMILTTGKGENAIRDTFIFLDDNSQIDIFIIDDNSPPVDDAKHKKIGEILVEREDISPDELGLALQDQKRIGEILINKGSIGQDKLRSALEEQEHIKEINEKRSEKVKTSSLRVASEKLDTLVDLVGELVTVQARLAEQTSDSDNAELIAISEEVGRLIDELRDNTMNIRMLPIGTTFSKFKRLVRDLSIKLKKEILLITEGGDTELDKTVIEQLNDPLVHIIRNSIDHGIELPEKRLENGKPREGKVVLSATHSGGNVVIKIADDGAGMNPETIFSKAVEKGLAAPDAELSEREILNLVFEPGFSTTNEITDVSGRGVGMDVVKRGIESLRGFIDIENHQGEGMTIIIKLPLTLAIIDGLIVDIDSEYFILPVSAIEECIELVHQEAKQARERNIVDFRGNVIPYVSLRKLFGMNDNYPDIEKVIIAEANGQIIGFGVDNLIGQSQVVIKTLGELYRNIKEFSGATILGDGTIALILDIAQLVSLKN